MFRKVFGPRPKTTPNDEALRESQMVAIILAVPHAPSV